MRSRSRSKHDCALFGLLSVAICSMALAVLAVGGCSKPASRPSGSSSGSAVSTASVASLPSSAYYMPTNLAKWVDPATGYDTTRQWTIDGADWPVLMLMSPSQSPQALVGFRDGTFAAALRPFGIKPKLERLDLPPRTFHALQRSKWPFVYMPLAVFTDYCRSQENQGQAGGLQYVAIAGSTAGGGYTMVARDPAIRSVKDLAGKTVAQVNSNPVPATLLASAAKQVGLSIGTGPGQIRIARGPGGDQLNEYTAGKYDAVISLNIVKAQVIAQGSHAVTDFAGVDYTPNYTVLVVERSVFEQKPEVVKAFLEAHYAANKVAVKEWSTTLRAPLMRSWNDYFTAEKAPSAKQRIVPDQAAYDAMLGNMYPEQRMDPKFLADQWRVVFSNGLWGWTGKVDVSKLSNLSMYDQVLAAHGERPQSSASK